MKHLELHILQSVPVSCLNRDDLNSPKTAIFGGVQRARVSSQCWKRAIREMAKEEMPNLFKGNRTRRMVFALKEKLVSMGMKESVSVTISEQVASIVETLDKKKDADGYLKIKTLMFFSEAEYAAIAKEIVSSEEVKQATKLLETALQKQDEEGKNNAIKAMGKTLEKGTIAKAIKSAKLKDAADIALFGRMVASDHSLVIDGASMFSHAISTHKADNEIDFFAAIDDLQLIEDSGAGHTSTLEFNSATYYRFTALNLEMLANDSHLKELPIDERKKVVRTFIKSTLMAMPNARKNSMNGNTLPGYVICIIREKGHPIQLINAFEKPVFEKNGIFEKSVERLKDEYKKLKETWNLDEKAFIAMPETSLKELLDEVEKYVE